ncbi:MAG: rRNA methyltransferase [Desulfurococcales archaeon]|nr:rRNA methyltransferase [Desulfurococcales archaeon]
MEKLRLVLVETEGSVNLGLIARLVENFEVEEFYLVSPKASIDEAERYAARAARVLRKAVIVARLEEALAETSFSICTSAISREDDPLRGAVDPETAVRAAMSVRGVSALVMGRESVGLTRRELALCNITSRIPSSDAYPELNLANATAIYLYEFYKARKGPRAAGVDPSVLGIVERYVEKLAREAIGDDRKREEIAASIKRLASKSIASQVEVKSLAFLLSRISRRLEKCTS